MSNNKKWIIYKHTNLLNGKVYIGQTCMALKKRFDNGNGYKNSPYFGNAITKYGWENFKHEILVNNIYTQEEANNMEMYYINVYDSTNREKGYNVTKGGNNAEHFYIPVYKYKLSGEFICMYDSITEAGKDEKIQPSLISAVCKNKRLSAGGYIWSYEKYERVSPISQPTKSIKIYKYSLSGKYICEYENVVEAGVEFGGDYCSHRILEYCYKENSQVFGYQWRIEKFEEIQPYKLTACNAKTVYKYDLNGEYICRYSSIKEASLCNSGISKMMISRCCNGEYSKAGEYQWSFIYKDNFGSYNDNNIFYRKRVVVYQYDKLHNFINKYTSFKEAERVTGVSRNKIVAYCKGFLENNVGDFIWEYEIIA